MIIPKNEKVAIKLSVIPAQLKRVLIDFEYHLKTTCDDSIVVFEVGVNKIVFDLPKKSNLNGAYRLIEIINEIWSLDKGQGDVLTLEDVAKKGYHLILRITPNTTNLSRDYIYSVEQVLNKERLQ